MLRPYPTSIDASAWALIWDAWKNKTGLTPSLVHVAYECLGVALGKIYPDGPPLVGRSLLPLPGEPLNEADDSAIDAALSYLSQPEGSAARQVAAVALPWSLLFQVILAILQKRWQ